MQDVRAPALGERGSLGDAEAVLLVDDRDGEIVELDALLDERVRPDDDRASRRDELPGGRVLASPERARRAA